MTSKMTEQNYYQILEVKTDAPHHEIVAAYQRAKEAYAPDSPALYTMFTKEEAEDLLKLIEEAFLVLGNQSKRRDYDQTLFNRSSSSSLEVTLPDFAPVDEAKKNSPPNSLSTTIPEGFIKGRLSVYEVKPDIEKEISNQTVFDGPFLRKVRQYKNINLEQLSKETRIGRSYLAAIEADDFEALPAPVFLRGFVIQVARILGLNETLVASSYMSRIKKDD